MSSASDAVVHDIIVCRDGFLALRASGCAGLGNRHANQPFLAHYASNLLCLMRELQHPREQLHLHGVPHQHGIDVIFGSITICSQELQSFLTDYLLFYRLISVEKSVIIT